MTPVGQLEAVEPQPDGAEVALAREWLALHAHPRRRPNPRAGSNTCSTVISKWAGRPVSGEAVRAAALQLGYTEQPIKHGRPGRIFGMSIRTCSTRCTVFTKSPRRENCSAQPTGSGVVVLDAARAERLEARLERLVTAVERIASALGCPEREPTNQQLCPPLPAAPRGAP